MVGIAIWGAAIIVLMIALLIAIYRVQKETECCGKCEEMKQYVIRVTSEDQTIIGPVTLYDLGVIFAYTGYGESEKSIMNIGGYMHEGFDIRVKKLNKDGLGG